MQEILCPRKLVCYSFINKGKLGRGRRTLSFLSRCYVFIIQFSSVTHFVTPWNAARQTSLSITNRCSQPKSMSIESVMLSNHLILCCSLLLLSSIFPSIRVFSKESALHIRWPKYWSFSFNISPSNEHPGLISLQSKGLSRIFSITTVEKHQFFGAQLSLESNSHIHAWLLRKPLLWLDEPLLAK